jgi:dynein heavy chain
MILSDHLKKFDPKIKNMTDSCVLAVNKVFQKILVNPRFSPTAKKFHYIFNLRDISRVIEGLLTMKPDRYRGESASVAKCFLHETRRVFVDRL